MDKSLGITLSLLVIAITLFSTALIMEYQSGLLQTAQTDRIELKGEVTVSVDGKVISKKPNSINVAFYDYIFCKTFNNTGACANAGNTSIGSTSMCTAGICRGHSFATLGMMLSTDGTVPNTSTIHCPGLQTTNGLGAKVASSQTHSINTNTLSITTSWTATGAVNNIQKACLTFVQKVGDTCACYQPIGDYQIYAETTFTSVNLGIGQSISVTWQFSL